MSIFSRPSPVTNDRPSEGYDLTTPEELAVRRRRRRLLIGGIVAAVVIGLGAWQGHALLGAIKGWQARRSATAALRLLDASQPEEAVGKIQDALVLRGTDPEVQRLTAIFLTRAGHGREAVGFWKQVELNRVLTVDEQRDFADDLLGSGDMVEAAKRLHVAWPEGTDGTPRDWSLAMRIDLVEHETAKAASLAKRLVDSKTTAVSEHQRLDAARTLLEIGDAQNLALAEGTLHAIADGGRSPESLEALLLLTQRAAQVVAGDREQKSPALDVAVQNLLDLAARIEKHPLAKVPQQLTALEARLVAQPDQRAQLIQGAIDKYGHSKDNNDLAALAAVLYARGEFQRVLEVLPPERATSSRALYLQYLDTLGALGRWDDIRLTIESQGFTLDPMVEQMYLARCATQTQHPEAAALHWESALRNAGTNPDKLYSLGRYAQANGVPDTAEAALRAALKEAPHNGAARQALLALLQTRGRTREAREEVKALLAESPEDTAARNDYAYLGALLGEDLTADRDASRELVREEPQSIPHRFALALAELRLHHGLTALEAIKAVPLPTFSSQARLVAVDAAVLWDTGFYDEARKLAAPLTQQQLLPEEWQLIQPIKTSDLATGSPPK